MLNLRRQLIRRLAANNRHLVIRNILPLLLFPKQLFTDDAQRPMDEHPQIRRRKLISAPFFQIESIAGKISKGTVPVLFKFRNRPSQHAVGCK